MDKQEKCGFQKSARKEIQIRQAFAICMVSIVRLTDQTVMSFPLNAWSNLINYRW